MQFLFRNKLICLVLTFVLTAAISGLYLKGLMFSPNEHAPTFGGDGLTIHYNLQYHAAYGEGSRLTAQYHPHGEVIYMTDAQGVVGWTLAKLRTFFPDIHEYAVGISNALIFWSNPLAACLLFLCFLKLKVDHKWAIIFSILIALLSPQIFRQTCGHYALGYSFLLPAVILYLLDKKFNTPHILKSIGLILLLVVLGLNNPYLLAIACSFILATFGLGLLSRVGQNDLDRKVIISWAVVVIISLLGVESTLHSLDMVDDRVAVPYGFFENLATLKGLLYPEGTMLNKSLSSLLGAKPYTVEGWCYIGLVPLLSLLSLPVFLFKRPAYLKALFKENNLLLLLLASAAVLVFAFGLPFTWAKNWSLDHLGKILQFRAPGRFTWVFYYMIAIVTALVLYHWLKHLSDSKNKWVPILLSSLVVGLWGIDVHQYLNWRTIDKIHHNAFSPSQLQKYNDLSTKYDINTSTYQGMYLLPTEHGWTDKVYHEGIWRSNYEGYRMSLASGLPLINGKLSRMSVSHTLAAMQLSGDPLIPREILSNLEKDKPILLVSAKETELTEDEKHLLSSGEKLHTDPEITLTRLDLKKYKSVLEAHRDTIMSQASSADSLSLAYLHFDESRTDKTFAGQGSKSIDKGKHTFSTINLPNNINGDSLVVSFWNYVDIEKAGGPWWEVKLLKNDELLSAAGTLSLKLRDTQSGWLRVEKKLPYVQGATHIDLYVESEYPCIIDEVLVRTNGNDILYNLEENTYLNNIKIK